MSYKLIAFDMDGTLLNDQKQVSAETIKAIEEAHAAGKTIILSTGRSPAELWEFVDILPQVHYFDCISGAMIYDVWEKKMISFRTLDPKIVDSLLKISMHEDIMIQMLSENSTIQRDKIELVAKYQVPQYYDLYSRVSVKPENLIDDYYANPYPISKLNMYHTDTDARERTMARLREAALPIEAAYSERTSIESSPLNTDKGVGLSILCDAIGIPLSETIAVGDADNDLAILKTAGLAVAMGNANQNVLSISDVVTADNNHDGCAKVIYDYLLK